MKQPELRQFKLLFLVAAVLLGGCGASPEGAPVAPGAVGGGGLRLQSLLGESAQLSAFRQAQPGVDIDFPIDHGPHEAFRSEWWYLTLMLSDEQGREYGGQFTLFRQALAAPVATAPAPSENPWRTQQAYLAHLAVTDVASNRHRSAERFSRGHPQLAGAQAMPFAAWLEDWRLASTGVTLLPMRFKANGPDFGWSLTLDGDPGRADAVHAKSNIVLQGDNGYSAKGPGQGSHYYSLTRLRASGSVVLEGNSTPVTGTAWFDREWSTSTLSPSQRGWDWFALQLADGRDLMVFRLRRTDCQRDSFDHGVLVAADGRTRKLAAKEFTVVPVRQWPGPDNNRLLPASPCVASAGSEDAEGTGTSIATGQGPWPLEWRLTLGAEQFLIRPAVLDQRMRTSVRYWEGLVQVFDALADPSSNQPVGRGYMELTGY